MHEFNKWLEGTCSSILCLLRNQSNIKKYKPVAKGVIINTLHFIKLSWLLLTVSAPKAHFHIYLSTSKQKNVEDGWGLVCDIQTKLRTCMNLTND